MALLTTEEVLNKTFGSVKFREGYDQAEVDEFLDEVVETIYALQVENNDLKQQLEAAQLRIAELEAGAPVAASVVETPEVVAPAPEVVAEPEVETPVAVATPVAEPAHSIPEDATSMLALAQRVHDEHVREGREQGERIVAEAQAQGETIVREAEQKRNEILEQLESDRNLLEGKINELKSFEADYRNRMREHLQHLLGEL